MEFRGLMGGFYRISEWIMRLSVINVLWVVCAIPFFLLGLTVLQAQSSDQVLQIFLLMAIVAPFTLFPSTTAMFSVARKWLTGEEDAPLFKTFFRSYKENFLQSMLGGFIYMILGVILYTNFRFYGSQTGAFGILRFLVLTLSVVLMISWFHFFSILSHLHMKLLQIVKNALLITIGNPIRSFTMMVLNATILYVSFMKFTFLIPFFMGSLMAVVSFWHFNLIFGKIQEKQQELTEKETEAVQPDNDSADEDPHAISKEPASLQERAAIANGQSNPDVNKTWNNEQNKKEQP